MKIRQKYHLFLISLLSLSFWVPEVMATSPGQVKALYNSLDAYSIAQHFAFYELYKGTIEAEKALQHAMNLLAGGNLREYETIVHMDLFNSAIDAVVAIINKQPDKPIETLSQEKLAIIERITCRLQNRQLKGYYARSETEVLEMQPEEIDLARGLFLTQLGEQDLNKIRSYEACIDLMALQIRARLAENASERDKIRAINDFIFGEMGFRFPPHSLYAKDIDLYTFLPSVLDSRRGVCLGVSILYICLAQRIGLTLQMITPPGHIYVRYCEREGEEVNIETTARGVHIDSEEYLNVETKGLQQRNIKEVIGLAHFNQAAVFWGRGKYNEALSSYKKAVPYLKNDKLLKEFMGYAYVLTENSLEGATLLQEVRNHVSEYSTSGNNIAEDYLTGKVDAEGIKAIFLEVDETRESIINKRRTLEKALERCPNFRAGLYSLAGTWLQLHRQREALELLEKYHSLDSTDPTVEYYLIVLYAERFDYNNAWKHLKYLEELVYGCNHHPKLLKELRQELALRSPE